LAQSRGAESAVQINESLSVGSLEILVVTDDRPGLLADLAAALSLHRYEIASAQLYTRKRPGQRDEAFDIFHVTHPGRTLDSDPSEEIALLQKTIGDLVSGRLSADTLLSRRSKLPNWARTGPRIKTEIGVDNKASNQYTVVDVYTRDRPELLYAIADTLHRHGLSIALAKVNTEGRRVADVFYVSAADGGKLAKGQLARLSEALRETIHKLDV
jgi:[protein-PII] uridylyltransferase